MLQDKLYVFAVHFTVALKGTLSLSSLLKSSLVHEKGIRPCLRPRDDSSKISSYTGMDIIQLPWRLTDQMKPAHGTSDFSRSRGGGGGEGKRSWEI